MGKRTESIVEIGIGEWGDDNEIVKGRERVFSCVKGRVSSGLKNRRL